MRPKLDVVNNLHLTKKLSKTVFITTLQYCRHKLQEVDLNHL